MILNDLNWVVFLLWTFFRMFWTIFDRLWTFILGFWTFLMWLWTFFNRFWTIRHFLETPVQLDDRGKEQIEDVPNFRDILLFY
jgi:hypothetical protein